MKVEQPHTRLKSLWGQIDAQHNAWIADYLTPGNTVLDIGCGYGALLSHLHKQGYQAEGIDLDHESVAIARQLFPDIQITLIELETFKSHAAQKFDVIIMKDSFHHLIGEGDPVAAFAAIRELLKNGGHIIIFDPNPNFIVRLARWLVRHKDPEATLEAATNLVTKQGFSIQKITYYEVLGLALSGGYVGYRLIPNIPFLNRLVASLNYIASLLASRLGMGRYLCWRYLIYAQKDTL